MVNNTLDMTQPLFLGGAALLLGILHTFLFFDGLFGLNYPVFIFCTIVMGLVLSHVYGRTLASDLFVLLSLGMFFAVMVFVRASELLTFFNIIGSLFIFLIAI